MCHTLVSKMKMWISVLIKCQLIMFLSLSCLIVSLSMAHIQAIYNENSVDRDFYTQIGSRQLNEAGATDFSYNESDTFGNQKINF